jgi:methionyl-tRNA synthetase
MVLITTAIAYPNGSPHLGHLYESVLASFVKKTYETKKKISSNECNECNEFNEFNEFNDKANTVVDLLTGTDEHGKKIETTAAINKLSAIELCNMNSELFKKMYDSINMDYSYFIRTSSPEHKKNVQNIVKKIFTQTQLIYLDNYDGYYSLREESFISDHDAKLSNYKDPVTGVLYEKMSEASYFYSLSKFKTQIQEYLASSPIIPHYKNSELISRLDQEGLHDLSITRVSFKWGIPFFDDSSRSNTLLDQCETNDHIIYVWFDALLNYNTGKKILNSSGPIIQIIGKDILWFHAVTYIGMLKGIYDTKSNEDLEQNNSSSDSFENYAPTKILVHGFILDESGRKMSKSLGNVVDPNTLLAKYPKEAILFYLINQTNLDADISFNEKHMIALYNNVLIKDFGNYIQRIMGLLTKEMLVAINEINRQIDKNVFFARTKEILEIFHQEFNFNKYNLKLKDLMDYSNQYLSETKPYKLDNLEKKTEILAHAINNMLELILLFYPIMPNKINEITSLLNISDDFVSIHYDKFEKLIIFNKI